MIHASLARRYARALILIGLQDKSTAAIDAELAGFEGVLQGSKELQEVLADPTVLPGSKRKILDGILDSIQMSETVGNFLLLLAEKGRLAVFPEIRREFQRQANEQAGLAPATVTSATPIEEAVRSKLVEKLAKLSGRTVILTQKVDPELIGGMVAEIGGVIYDGSLRTQLRALRESAKG